MTEENKALRQQQICTRYLTNILVKDFLMCMLWSGLNGLFGYIIQSAENYAKDYILQQYLFMVTMFVVPAIIILRVLTLDGLILAGAIDNATYTCCLLGAGKMTVPCFILRLTAQMTGSTVAALLVHHYIPVAFTFGSIHAAGKVDTAMLPVMLSECCITSLLVLSITFAAKQSNSSILSFTPIALVILANLVFAPISNALMNPNVVLSWYLVHQHGSVVQIVLPYVVCPLITAFSVGYVAVDKVEAFAERVAGKVKVA